MASVPELLNLEKFKSEVHRILISKLDLEKLSRVESAQARQESRGLHYRTAHPALAPTAAPTLLTPASA